MRTRRYRAVALIVALTGIVSAELHAASAVQTCGEVTIGQMNWPSAELVANIDSIVLSAGFGCEVDTVTGDSLSTLVSMTENGSPDIAPMLWVDAIRESLDSALAVGQLTMAAEVLSDGGEEGWWIPKFIVEEYPHINTVEDALERPDLFPSLSQKGADGVFHNCPDGLKACQISNTNLFNAYKAQDKGFTLTDPGSVAGLDASIAKAIQSKVGWLGYYWAPTATLGRYEMVKLDTVAHDEEHWTLCTSIAECEDPQINGWARNEVFSVVTSSFARRHSDAMDYLNVRQWDNNNMNKLLAWMADNQATGAEAADYFLQNYQNVWFPWVSDQVRHRISAVLSDPAR